MSIVKRAALLLASLTSACAVTTLTFKPDSRQCDIFTNSTEAGDLHLVSSCDFAVNGDGLQAQINALQAEVQALRGVLETIVSPPPPAAPPSVPPPTVPPPSPPSSPPSYASCKTLLAARPDLHGASAMYDSLDFGRAWCDMELDGNVVRIHESW